MSKKEFIQISSTVVEQKLVELLGDPDEGLAIKENLRKRLIRQKKAVAKGDRGIDLPQASGYSTRKGINWTCSLGNRLALILIDVGNCSGL
jgi:hypothetical protein